MEKEDAGGESITYAKHNKTFFFAWFSTLTHDCLVKNNKCTMKIHTMEDVVTCVDACTHLNVFY